MSLLSRLFGRSPPASAAPEAGRPATAGESPPRPDPAARAREEEAAVAQAVAAADMVGVGKWVLDGSTTRTRQLAARAITDPEQLRELIRASRGKDKNVYRILTTKRDALVAGERSARQREAEVAAAATAIARHSERPCDAAYAATLARLEERWQAVAPQASAELREQVARHLACAREVIEQHRRTRALEAERQRAATLAAEQERRQRELEAQAAATAAEEQARLAAAEQQAAQARREADAAASRQLMGLLRQAQAALEQGNTAHATRLRDAIKARLPDAPALPAWFERKLQAVDARIDELRDWKTFTVVPKRAQLVQRMQSLVGADMSPEELARHIRRLRDEWRTLHRGTADEPTPEREQFEEAAERAYEPCRGHFARQAEQRKENQALREALIERLAAFAAEHSGEAVNWRLVQQTLAEARSEWRQYAPVDQAVVKSLQERFHAITDALQARLAAEYARNTQARQALIARATELIGVADTRQAIEDVKSLQRAWKSVGLVPRHHDHALWEEFRKHCDAVFRRSSDESAAYGAALEANQARATSLCEALEQIATLTGAALEERSHQLDVLRTEFEALELPRTSARDLRQRFARASDGYRDAMGRHRAALVRQGWSELLVAAERVRAYALAAVQRVPSTDSAALRAAAGSAVAALAQSPKGARALLEQQMARVDAGTIGSDLAVNERALRLLCVRAELLADVPTPPEDLELRREYQMQRLVESMGRGERVTPAGFDDLALEWLAVGPVEPAVHDALHARFEHCRAAASR